jgi:putative PEP-CTERM system histidine kinase
VAVTVFSLIPFAAATFSLVLAFASLLGRKPSVATWFFFAGMLTLATDSVFTALSLRVTNPEDLVSWLTSGFIVKSVVAVAWLGFSLTYSRGDYRESLLRWRIPLVVIGLLPIALSLGLREHLFQVVTAGASGEVRLQSGQIATVLNVIFLVTLMLILMNVEQTFRSAVGTLRWRIKFVVLALAVIFGARLYVQTQVMLFSTPDVAQSSVESAGLLIGCVFMAVAYARTGLAEIDVYPSLAVLRSSLTILLVGGYLFIVGVLAQIVRRFGGAESFRLQAFVVLLGMSGLAVLLLSDRARQHIHVFVVRHFKKAQYDSVRIWTLFSQRLASVKDQAHLCEGSAKLISETFDVLSVTVWLVEEETGRLAVAASTAPQSARFADETPVNLAFGAVTAALQVRSSPFDLEAVNEAWAEEWRQLNPTAFPNGGNRWCVPLRVGEQSVGALVLADRVSGALYTVEELELLKCIGNQIASVLLNLRLASEVAHARELEALRTMSAFFVHDLKNAAASLNLMLKNLPVHFDDPAFRADALRGIGNSARRIEEMIARLGAFRSRPTVTRVDADLNKLVEEALEGVDVAPGAKLSKDLQPLPTILADREQIRSVVTNLLLNARDALQSGGSIRVRTEHRHGRVLLSVADDGSGMSSAFLRDQLFRPFQSTKKNGLGIGLFQCRAIVQAHGGGIHAESEPGRGTTFTVSFPVSDRR